MIRSLLAPLILAAAVSFSPATSAPLVDLDTPAVAVSSEIGEDDMEELTRLAEIEGNVIGQMIGIVGSIVGGIMALLTTGVMLWIRADRKRTDETMKTDRAQVQNMTGELIKSLREHAQIYKEADQANRSGLAEVASSVGRVDEDIRAVRRDLTAIDGRVTNIENTIAATSTTRGRRAT